MIKNNKGYTLIELLITLAIITVLMLILVPAVLVLQEQNKEKTYNSLIDSIKTAANLYVGEHKYDDVIMKNLSCPNQTTTTVTLDTLVKENLLSSPVVNPKTNENVDLNKTVIIKFDCTAKTFSFEFSL